MGSRHSPLTHPPQDTAGAQTRKITKCAFRCYDFQKKITSSNLPQCWLSTALQYLQLRNALCTAGGKAGEGRGCGASFPTLLDFGICSFSSPIWFKEFIAILSDTSCAVACSVATAVRIATVPFSFDYSTVACTAISRNLLAACATGTHKGEPGRRSCLA